VRTTIRIDEHLLREAKKLAATTGRTLTAVIEDALREVLARQSVQQTLPPYRIQTFRGDGTMPGVDLNNTASLWDLMDAPD